MNALHRSWWTWMAAGAAAAVVIGSALHPSVGAGLGGPSPGSAPPARPADGGATPNSGAALSIRPSPPADAPDDPAHIEYWRHMASS